MYDYGLQCFKNSDSIPNEILYGNNPHPNTSDVFQGLADEGMVIIDRYGVSITAKGKDMIASGGFLRRLLIERLKIVGIVVGILGGIAGIISLIF